MKNKKLTATLLILVLLVSGCGKGPTVPFNNLNERQGRYYLINSERGFTGVGVEKYRNGQYKMRKHFVDGLPHGLEEEWGESGEIKWRMNYKKGKEEGKYEEFYPSGSIRLLSYYRDGKREGESEEFYPSSSRKTLSVYKNDVRINHRFFSPNGSEITKSIEEIISGRYVRFYADGRSWRVLFLPNRNVQVFGEGVNFPVYQGSWSPGKVSTVEIVYYGAPPSQEIQIGINDDGEFTLKYIIVSSLEGVVNWNEHRLNLLE